MTLWIMAAPYNAAAHRFIRRITKESSQTYLSFPTVKSLTERLCRPVSGDPLLILFPANSLELDELLKARHLMRDLRIILVLAETDFREISAAHGLRPRYIGYCDGDMSDVIAVTAKITSGSIENCNPGKRVSA